MSDPTRMLPPNPLQALMPLGVTALDRDFDVTDLLNELLFRPQSADAPLRVVLTLKAALTRMGDLESRLANTALTALAQKLTEARADQTRDEIMKGIQRALEGTNILEFGEDDWRDHPGRLLAVTQRICSERMNPVVGGEPVRTEADAALEAIFDLVKLPHASTPRTPDGRPDPARIIPRIQELLTAYTTALRERDDLQARLEAYEGPAAAPSPSLPAPDEVPGVEAGTNPPSESAAHSLRNP